MQQLTLKNAEAAQFDVFFFDLIRQLQRRPVAPKAAASIPRPVARPFEADLDFKARLWPLTRLACVLAPPVTFWLACAIWQGTTRPQTIVERLLIATFSPSKGQWFAWLASVFKALALLFCSAAASILMRYQLREQQVLCSLPNILPSSYLCVYKASKSTPRNATSLLTGLLPGLSEQQRGITRD
jgi:hypothetical protein